MKTKIITGMFWHCHHDRLCEYVWDYQERVNYIKDNKPKNEIKTRLRLFKKIKGKLPKELEDIYKKYEEVYAKWKEADVKWKEACAKYEEAYAKWKEAYVKWAEACVKWKEAYAKWNEADVKWNEAYAKYLPELEKLHKKECGCKEWNGKKLVFEK